MEQKKILIVGDYALTKNELDQFFSGKETVITDVAKSYENGLCLFASETPDLLISDIFLNNNKTGIDLVQNTLVIRKVPVIYIAERNDNNVLKKAFRTNPDALLIKPFTLIQFIITIKRVLYQLKSDRFVDDHSLNIVNPISEKNKGEIKDTRKPTIRELEVIRHIAKGDTTKSIADKLFISYTTVQTHRKNLLNKYKAKSCAELVNIACQNKWLDLAV